MGVGGTGGAGGVPGEEEGVGGEDLILDVTEVLLKVAAEAVGEDNPSVLVKVLERLAWVEPGRG